ncbi:hypothetical protein [Nodosilinea nodulosa]|nr:hypothetical protein [Nodosilinea nodulosa]
MGYCTAEGGLNFTFARARPGLSRPGMHGSGAAAQVIWPMLLG